MNAGASDVCLVVACPGYGDGGRGLSACGGYALRAAAMGSKLALLRAYAAALSVNGYPHASSGSTT